MPEQPSPVMAMVDPGNAAAPVVALADLAHAGELDLTDCDREDIAAVLAVLAVWLTDSDSCAQHEPPHQFCDGCRSRRAVIHRSPRAPRRGRPVGLVLRPVTAGRWWRFKTSVGPLSRRRPARGPVTARRPGTCDRYGWIEDGPLPGRDASRSAIRLKAGSGREQPVRFRARNAAKQTMAAAHTSAVLDPSRSLRPGDGMGAGHGRSPERPLGSVR